MCVAGGGGEDVEGRPQSLCGADVATDTRAGQTALNLWDMPEETVLEQQSSVMRSPLLVAGCRRDAPIC